MKEIIFWCCLIAIPAAFRAQTISDCDGAIPLCGDLYTEDQAPLNTGTVYEYTGVCNLNVESNSVWYTFTVQADGLLSFVLTPLNLNDDYDWALFDISAGGCEGIYAGGPSPEVSCNSWGTLFPPNGPTGISTLNGGTGNSNGPGDLNGPPFNGDLPVQAGQEYALVVMNWSLSQDGYTIDFGQSTASLYDEFPPYLVSVESNCANTELVVVFSEPIVVSTVQAEDFIITGPGGSFTVVDVNPASGVGATLDTEFVVTIDTQITEAGVYTFSITDLSLLVEDLCGNPGEGSVNFTANVPMTYDVAVSTACNGVGGSIAISNISGGAAPYEYYLDNVIQPGLSSENLNDGSYTVLVSDNANCEFTQEIEVPDNPISVVMAAPDTVSCIDPVTVLSGSYVVPDQPVNYSWSTSDGAIVSGGNSQLVSVGAPGTYFLTVTNSTNGCSAQGSVLVTSNEEVLFDATLLRFPNVVTPNGDSKNENWRPFLLSDPGYNVLGLFNEYELKVFNRWGNLIFESTTNLRFWNAGDVPEGNYFYTLVYTTECGEGARGKVEGYVQVLNEN